jgi:ribosome-associated protein
VATGENRSQAIRESLLEACRCARIADGFKGENTLVLDLTKITPIFDFFVLTTGTSRRQMMAIAEEINKQLKAAGTRRQGVEGTDQSQWIVQDFGNVVVHIFSPEMRDVYDLERLWADAPRIDWQSVLEEERL